ncbi:hypothetical protein AGABI1DRAFT_91695 [Agaricus bisporus var. burnettii JB137-S8]|uniref:KOW domain-containing protein n=1 Tax=Agaricus bisporus var. burnettii (strain JB137-S8 / ATCC MYA-4627 / FGSC 10392) TaxID=597362 RepID=K5XYT0_AGABU|nr:uncharacterized protein AGABI1DRAFT_91695 [Agaricus bisporus var. burnettii JB137-S8]EKM80530.1 hypothetical protein AGABI1DRAFT_91695 [Agaricus bisporus var. burnettii JB137-S8]
MGKRKRGTRPPQALFDPVKCGQPISTVVTAGGYQFEDQIFDRAGYAILKDLPFGRYRPVLHASRTEYILFSDCTALSSVELCLAMKLLANRTLKRFDKVRVLDGQFEGCVATVQDVEVYHLTIELPDVVYQGSVELPLLSVTWTYEVGDWVLVNSGKHNGLHGFVVSVDTASESIILHSTTLQESDVVLCVDDVQQKPHDESYVLPRSIPQKQPCPRDKNVERYISSKVIIQSNPFKGYRGVVRSINGGGVADIELDLLRATGTQMTQQHICELYYIISRTPNPDPMDVSDTTNTTWCPGEEAADRELIPDADRHWISVAERSLTKIRKLSVKIAECTDDFNDPEVNGKMGVMHGVNGNKVRVYVRPLSSDQQGFFREIYYPFLSYIPPTRKNQTVVVVEASPDLGCVQNIISTPGDFTALGAVSGKYKFVKLKEIRTTGLASFL